MLDEAVGTTLVVARSKANAPARARRRPQHGGTARIYDAAVIGAGIVGLAAAVALARDGYRIVLVERSPPQRRRGGLGFDLRSVALTPGSVDLLRALGGIDDADLAPIEAMHVWEYDGAASLRFAGNGAIAFVAEHSVLTTRLWQVAAECLDIVAQVSVAGLAERPDGVSVAGPDVFARLVIGADGADSIVRELAHTSQRLEPPYRGGGQRAVVTVARAAKPHGDVAFQRFGRSGPVALLPLCDRTNAGSASPSRHTVSVIWSASEAQAQHLQRLSDEAFRTALGEETEGMLGDFLVVDRRLSFPVRQALAADFNPSPRTLIIGDAARTLHPLAGQGVNLGLEDVRALVASAGHSDLGAPGRWRGFARERRARSKLMMASMRALLAAYCGPHAGNPWMRLARNAAVRFIDAAPDVKAQLIREAMGLGPMACIRGESASPPAS